mmetsp:Transcript_16988/g.39620  ORF Transcript_16988/g.39620 Transcript_16988/m.39620 type:complete len:668 (+) Transcript_16988:146-2149(+)
MTWLLAAVVLLQLPHHGGSAAAARSCQQSDPDDALLLLQRFARASTSRPAVHGSALAAVETVHCAIDHELAVVGFDGMRTSFFADRDAMDFDRDGFCDSWLVKSEALQVQGRFSTASSADSSADGDAQLVAVAIGGRLLKGNRITLEPWSGKIVWHTASGLQTEMLGRSTTTWMLKDLVHASYAEGRGRDAGVVELRLQHGVGLWAKRGEHMLEVNISMPKPEATVVGPDGQCGRFNGNPKDDTFEFVDGRSALFVNKSDVLFHESLRRAAVGSMCSLFGDPHIRVFDDGVPSLLDLHKELPSKKLNVTPGVYWIVDSPTLKVQGRYSLISYLRGPQPFLTAVAVSGPLLHGNILDLRPMNNNITWTSLENRSRVHVLKQLPSLFRRGSVVAQYHNLTSVVKHPSRYSTGVHVSLPYGIQLEVNRYDRHLDFAVVLPRAAADKGRVSGQCGNYNGNVHDDAPEQIQKRAAQIPFVESLFVRSANTSLLYKRLKQWQSAGKVLVDHRPVQEAEPPAHQRATTSTLHAELPVHHPPETTQSPPHAVLPVQRAAGTSTHTSPLAVLPMRHDISTTRPAAHREVVLPVMQQTTTTEAAHHSVVPVAHQATTTRLADHTILPGQHQRTTVRVTLPPQRDVNFAVHHVVPEEVLSVQDATSTRRRRRRRRQLR